jgi:hypothetical protein
MTRSTAPMSMPSSSWRWHHGLQSAALQIVLDQGPCSLLTDP